MSHNGLAIRVISPMSLAIPKQFEVVRIAETLAIGAIGGFIFEWIQFPGGYISGAMTTVAFAAIAGRPVLLARPLTYSFMVLLGISVGSLASAQLLSSLGAYPLSLTMLAASTVCTMFGCAIYLERVHGWDKTTAFLAANPGALSQTVALGAEKGADVSAIAVAQIMRVVVLTAALPLALSLAGVAASAPTVSHSAEVAPVAFIALIAAAIATALVLRWLNFPASWMFGAMLSSGILHATGLIEGGLPFWAKIVALIGIGTLIGTSFARVTPRVLLSYMSAALGSFGVAAAICTVFVGIVALVTKAKIADLLISFSPGAMDAMFGLALTLHIDPIFVGVHHLSRYFFASLLTPGIVHLFNRPQDDADD